jgi:hypothetical protein
MYSGDEAGFIGTSDCASKYQPMAEVEWVDRHPTYYVHADYIIDLGEISDHS